MWRDQRGVFHTIALPEPTELMSPEFRDSLDVLLATSAGLVSELLENEEGEFFASQAPVDPLTEAGFEAAPPPMRLLTRRVASVDDLGARVRDVDYRWRLDALMALGDYCSDY